MIFAGYPVEMAAFVTKNAGMQRRITHTFDFADYTPLELERIFNLYCKGRGFGLEQARLPRPRRPRSPSIPLSRHTRRDFSTLFAARERVTTDV